MQPAGGRGQNETDAHFSSRRPKRLSSWGTILTDGICTQLNLSSAMHFELNKPGSYVRVVGICQVVFPKMLNCSEPLKLRTGALPLRFATPGYFQNMNRGRNVAEFD